MELNFSLSYVGYKKVENLSESSEGPMIEGTWRKIEKANGGLADGEGSLGPRRIQKGETNSDPTHPCVGRRLENIKKELGHFISIK